MHKKVLFINSSDKSGGAERSLSELINCLKRMSVYDIALASPDSSLLAPIQTFTIPPIRLHRPSCSSLFFKSIFSICKARHALKTVLSQYSPNIIHANGIASVFAIPQNHADVIWHVRDMPRAPYAYIAARKCRRLIATSESVADQCRKCLPSSMHHKIITIENGIDFSRFNLHIAKDEARSRLNIPAENITVGMIANMVPWKNHEVFINAAAPVHKAMNKKINWIIAGDDLFNEHGDYIDSLRQSIADKGLDNNFYLISNRDACEILPALDLLVHPAVNEPFGRVICEAMACDVPVIAVNSGGPGYIINDNANGFLVDIPSPEFLSEKIMFALLNSEIVLKVTAQARKDVILYDIKKTTDKILSMYDSLS